MKIISRVKRSFWVILAIFGSFFKTEKARIGAISWADMLLVVSVYIINSKCLTSSINLEKIGPVQHFSLKAILLSMSQRPNSKSMNHCV